MEHSRTDIASFYPIRSVSTNPQSDRVHEMFPAWASCLVHKVKLVCFQSQCSTGDWLDSTRLTSSWLSDPLFPALPQLTASPPIPLYLSLSHPTLILSASHYIPKKVMCPPLCNPNPVQVRPLPTGTKVAAQSLVSLIPFFSLLVSEPHPQCLF